MPQRLQFKSTTIDDVTRTAITVPTSCNRVVVHNTDQTRDCTLFDAASGGNSVTLFAGKQETFESPEMGSRGFPAYRWESGDTVCWATAATGGTGPITLRVVV